MDGFLESYAYALRKQNISSAHSNKLGAVLIPQAAGRLHILGLSDALGLVECSVVVICTPHHRRLERGESDISRSTDLEKIWRPLS